MPSPSVSTPTHESSSSHIPSLSSSAWQSPLHSPIKSYSPIQSSTLSHIPSLSSSALLKSSGHGSPRTSAKSSPGGVHPPTEYIGSPLSFVSPSPSPSLSKYQTIVLFKLSVSPGQGSSPLVTKPLISIQDKVDTLGFPSPSPSLSWYHNWP